MQLQDVGRERVDDARQSVVVGVDAEGGDPCPAAGPAAQRARRLEADVARALGEENEADDVGARPERDVQGRSCREAADFDDRRHSRLFRAKRLRCQRRRVSPP